MVKRRISVESINNQKQGNKITNSILMVLVIILFLKHAIDLFFFDLLPTAGDNIFWVIISILFIIVLYIKKSYLFLTAMFVILLVGLLNF